MVLDGVVARDGAGVPEGEDGAEVERGVERAPGRLGLAGRDGEARVEARQEALEHGLRLAMVEAEARRSSVTRRSWNVPAIRSTRPLACGERAKIRRTPSSAIARANWVDASPPARCWAEARKTAWRSL